MAGTHADRGITSHKIISGETPVIGLRVWDYDLKSGTITKLDSHNSTENNCGWYCEAWVTVTRDDGSARSMNCERMTTVHPSKRTKP